MKDPYRTLGLPRTADQATIRKAYRKLAKTLHPDVNNAPNAEARFKAINAAYDILGDEQKRAWFDEFGEASLRSDFNPDRARAMRSAFRNMGGGGRGGGRGGFGGGRFSGFEDIFGQAFGGQTGGWGAGPGPGGYGRGNPGGFGGRGPQPKRPAKGADIEVSVEVELLDALKGGETTVEFRRPGRCAPCSGSGGTGRTVCERCGGQGRVSLAEMGVQAAIPCPECDGEGHRFTNECPECAGTGRTMAEKRLKVRVPMGAQDGQVLRLRGQGGEPKEAGPPGNLLISLQVKPHPFLTRSGDRLELEVPLTIGEAINGARVTIPTLAGDVHVTIPAGASNGAKLRLRGKGAPKPDGTASDLYLVLRPKMPNTPSEQVKTLAADLDEQAYETDIRDDFKL